MPISTTPPGFISQLLRDVLSKPEFASSRDTPVAFTEHTVAGASIADGPMRRATNAQILGFLTRP